MLGIKSNGQLVEINASQLAEDKDKQSNYVAFVLFKGEVIPDWAKMVHPHESMYPQLPPYVQGILHKSLETLRSSTKDMKSVLFHKQSRFHQRLKIAIDLLKGCKRN
mgnify:CR=1 FL=1